MHDSKGYFFMGMVDRAKKALDVTTDLAMAKAIGVSASVIGGYNRRNTVPLEQLTKIVEMTGADLNWLILGQEPKPPSSLSIAEQMLLTGFRSLDTQKQNLAIQQILQLAQAEDAQALQKTINAQQYNEGDGRIGTINVGHVDKK